MEPMTIREILEAVGGKLLGEFRISTGSGQVGDRQPYIHARPLVHSPWESDSTATPSMNAALEGGGGLLYPAGAGELSARASSISKWALHPKGAAGSGRHYKKKFRIPLVAVTGSVGKTTTKDMVAAVLGGAVQGSSRPRATSITRFGVPLTLLRLTSTKLRARDGHESLRGDRLSQQHRGARTWRLSPTSGIPH